MKVHSIILTFCLVTAAGCLASGYILAGYWLIMPLILAMMLVWLILKRRSKFWLASGLLLIYVFLSIIGVMLNLSIYLMILGCTAALASWDLTHFGLSIADNSWLKPDAPLERSHLRSLTTAVFSGLLSAFISSYLNLQVPFGILVILVLIAIGCLTYGVQCILKNG